MRRVISEWRAGSGWSSRGRGSTGAMSPKATTEARAVPGDRRATRRPDPDVGSARGARDLRVPRRSRWRRSHRTRGGAPGTGLVPRHLHQSSRDDGPSVHVGRGARRGPVDARGRARSPGGAWALHARDRASRVPRRDRMPRRSLELAARHAATAIEIKLGAGFEELNGLDLYPQALVDALRGDVRRPASTRRKGWRGPNAATTSTRTATGRCSGSSSFRWGASPRHASTSTPWSDSCARWVSGSRASSRSTPTRSRRGSAWETSTARPSCSGSSRICVGRPDGHGLWPRRPDAAGCCSPRAAMVRGAALMFERALEEHRRVPQPLELARTLLAKGQVERRAKQRSAARRTLQQALADLR